MSVLYDAMGNAIGNSEDAAFAPSYTGDTGEVLPTANPDVVKIHLPAGATMPDWVRATAAQPDGSVIGYGPTATAIAKGYIVAATDTIADLPNVAADAVKKALDWTPLVLIGAVALVVLARAK